MKIDQPKIPIEIEVESYKLLRESDQLIKVGSQLKFIEWNEDGTFKKAHNEPKVGYSAILDPHRLNFTWLTTTITEILEESENKTYLKFKTKNSVYELFTEI
jgi:hypothetical protein